MARYEVLGGKLRIENNNLIIYELNGRKADITDELFSPSSKKRIINAILYKEQIIRSIKVIIHNDQVISDCSLYYSKEIVFQIINIKTKIENENLGFIYDVRKRQYRFIKKMEWNIPYKFDDNEKLKLQNKINRATIKAIRGKKNNSFEHTLVDLENTLIYATVYITYVNQKIIKIVINDNTKQHEMINKIVQAEKLQSLGNMAGGLAHDLNNQLMIIEGCTNLLAKKIDNEIAGKYLDNINKSIHDSSELIQKLLAFSMQTTISLEIVDISELLEDMRYLVTHIISSKYRLIFNNEIFKANVMADKSGVKNAILNIIKNSCEAFDKDENVLMINLKYIDLNILPDGVINYVEDFEGKYILIEIIDNGCGISGDLLHKICDPFYTTRMSTNQTGLGLSTVLGTVIQHNGLLSILSRPNIGTKVSIYLKAVDQMQQLSFDLQDERKKILIIDDEELIRSIIHDLLYEIGFDSVTYPSGNSAVEFYENNYEKIDLVLCDMIMPGLNGKDTYYALKKINRNLKFILLSGYSMNEVDESFRDEISEFISKPVSLSNLENCINKILLL